MHVVFGTIMYANSSIVPSKYVFMSTANKILEEASTGWRIKNFFQLHIILFLGLMIIIAFIYLFWAFIVRTIAHCVKHCSKDEDDEDAGRKYREEHYEKDFYTCVDFRTLIDEFKMATEASKRSKAMFNQGDLKQLPKWKFDPYYESLDKKQAEIRAAIESLANRKAPDGERYSSKDPKTDFKGVIEDLMHKEMEGKLPDCKMKDDLKTYELLHNSNYKRLTAY